MLSSVEPMVVKVLDVHLKAEKAVARAVATANCAEIWLLVYFDADFDEGSEDLINSARDEVLRYLNVA